MSTANERFDSAREAVHELTNRPGNDDLLLLYGLFKQATEGDNAGKRPGLVNPVGRAKFDAWSELAGTPSEDAMSDYADLVERLQAED